MDMVRSLHQSNERSHTSITVDCNSYLSAANLTTLNWTLLKGPFISKDSGKLLSYRRVIFRSCLLAGVELFRMNFLVIRSLSLLQNMRNLMIRFSIFYHTRFRSRIGFLSLALHLISLILQNLWQNHFSILQLQPSQLGTWLSFSAFFRGLPFVVRPRKKAGTRVFSSSVPVVGWSIS